MANNLNLGAIPLNPPIDLAVTPPNLEPCLWHQETRIRRAISCALAALSAAFGGIGYYAATHASVAALFLAPSLAAPIALTLSAVFLTAALTNFIVLVKLYPSLNDPKERQKIRNQMSIERLSAMPYGEIRALYPRKDVLTDAEINTLLAEDVKNLSYDQFVQKHGKNEVFEILTQPHRDIIGCKFIKKIGAVMQGGISFIDACNLFKTDLSLLGLDSSREVFAKKLLNTILESGLGLVQIRAQYAAILAQFKDMNIEIPLKEAVLNRDLNKLNNNELSYAEFIKINGRDSIADITDHRILMILETAFCNLPVSKMLSDECEQDLLFFFGAKKSELKRQISGKLEERWTEFDLNSLPEGFMLAWQKGYVSYPVLSALHREISRRGIIESARLNPQIFTDILNPKGSERFMLNTLEIEIGKFKDFNQLRSNVPEVLFQKGWLTKNSKALSSLVSQHIVNNNLHCWLGLSDLTGVDDRYILAYTLMSDNLAIQLENWKKGISTFQATCKVLEIEYAQAIEQAGEKEDQTILSVQHQLDDLEEIFKQAAEELNNAKKELEQENAKLETAYTQKLAIQEQIRNLKQDENATTKNQELETVISTINALHDKTYQEQEKLGSLELTILNLKKQQKEIEVELQEKTEAAKKLKRDTIEGLQQQYTQKLEQLKEKFRQSFEAEIRAIAPNFKWQDEYFKAILPKNN